MDSYDAFSCQMVLITHCILCSPPTCRKIAKWCQERLSTCVDRESEGWRVGGLEKIGGVAGHVRCHACVSHNEKC